MANDANLKHLQKILTAPNEGLLDVKEADGAQHSSDARQDLRRGIYQLRQVASQALERIARGDWTPEQVEQAIGGLEAELVASDDGLASSGAFPTESLHAQWRQSTEMLIASFDLALTHLESGETADMEDAQAELDDALQLRQDVSDQLEAMHADSE